MERSPLEPPLLAHLAPTASEPATALAPPAIPTLAELDARLAPQPEPPASG